MKAASLLESQGVSAEVVDLRVLNPLDPRTIIESTTKTSRLLAVDVDIDLRRIDLQVAVDVLNGLEVAHASLQQSHIVVKLSIIGSLQC